MSQRRYADIQKDNFFFFQKSVNSIRVDAIVEGLRKGCNIPDILVHKITEGSYGIYDGNHRFMAYRILGRDPSIREVSFGSWPNYKLDLPDVVFKNGSLFQRKQLRESLRFLPSDVVFRFCKERNLPLGYFLPQ